MKVLPKSPARGKPGKRRPILRAIKTAESDGNGDAQKSVVAPEQFQMPQVAAPTFPDRRVDVRDHGAQQDVDCTAAIAAAIKACGDAGGGRVVIPAGNWLTGPIHLRSNIDLHLARGA